MASRAHKDGAKPGKSEPDPDQYEFNAEERAQAREKAPVTIGEKQYFRSRLNWVANKKVTEFGDQQVRNARRQQRNGMLMDELEDKLLGDRDPETGEWRIEPARDQATVDDLEKQIEELRAKNRELADEMDAAAFGILIARLRDETGKPPTMAFLKEHLDLAEVGDLARLLSGAEAAEGPTPTPSSSD